MSREANPLHRSGVLPVWRRLHRELARLAEADRQTPCQADPDLFTSDASTDRAAAARRCASCPVLTECHEYAEVAGERWHVWAGVDRTPARRRDEADEGDLAVSA